MPTAPRSKPERSHQPGRTISGEYDLVVVGAGLAGCVSALVLSRLRPQSRILVVERRDQAHRFLGEYVDPEGVRLWRSLDLPALSGIESHGVACCRSDGTVQRHAFSAGAGLCLDWAKVTAALDRELAGRSVSVVRGTRLEKLEPAGKGWSLTLAQAHRWTTVTTRFLLDATGRDAALGWRLGSRREVLWDNQSVSQLVAAPAENGDLIVEWSPEGWLSVHPLPGRGQMVRLVTAATHPNLEAALRASSCLVRLKGTTLGPVFRDDVSTARMVPAGGPGWLAVGDAGWALDPLSGKGTTEALAWASASCPAGR